MEIFAWVAAVLLLAIAVLRAWAASMLLRRMASVPASRQGAARLIVLSTFATSLLGATLAVTVGLATVGRLGGWRVPFLIIIGVSLIGAVPGIGAHLRRYQEPWLEDWRRGAPG